MKKQIYTAFVFILVWYLLTSGVIVSSLFFDKLFHDSKTMIVPPSRFISGSVVGLIIAIYFVLSSKKKEE
jgi:hypothetical protein